MAAFSGFDSFSGASATGSGSYSGGYTGPGSAWANESTLSQLGPPPQGFASWMDWLIAHPDATIGDARKAAGLNADGTTPGHAPDTPGGAPTSPFVYLGSKLGIDTAELGKLVIGAALYLVFASALLALVWPKAGTAIVKAAKDSVIA